MQGKYFSKTIRPIIPVASLIDSNKTDKPFSASDILFDWFALDIPKGPARLSSISAMIRGEDEGLQTARDFLIYFAKSDADGTAPASLGTENDSASGLGYYNNLLGFQLVDISEIETRLDRVSLATMGTAGGDATGRHVNLVLQGEPDSGTNVGYDKIYVAAMGGASNTWDFSTGVIANGAVTAGAASTFDVTSGGSDANIVFAPGDLICVHDSDTAIGTVKSVTANNIVLESATGVNIANNDEIINVRPITVILGFEK